MTDENPDTLEPKGPRAGDASGIPGLSQDEAREVERRFGRARNRIYMGCALEILADFVLILGMLASIRYVVFTGVLSLGLLNVLGLRSHARTDWAARIGFLRSNAPLLAPLVCASAYLDLAIRREGGDARIIVPFAIVIVLGGVLLIRILRSDRGPKHRDESEEIQAPITREFRGRAITRPEQ